MDYLSERLEIRLHADMMNLLRKEARQRNVSVAHIVRQAVEAFLKEKRQSQLESVEYLYKIGVSMSQGGQMKQVMEDVEGKVPSLVSRLVQLASENEQTVDRVLEAVMQDYLDRLEKECIHRETEHFWNTYNDLAAKYMGEFIAMVKGQVVDHDVDLTALEIRVRQQYGSLPVLIAPVKPEPRRDLVWRGGRLKR